MKSFPLTKRSFRYSILLKGSCAAFVLLLFHFSITAQDDFLAQMQDDFLSTLDDTARTGSLSTTSDDADKSPSAASDMSPHRKSRRKKASDEVNGLSNIVLEDKSVRAYGWGEYKVMGRCLCCDNSLDGDCILVQTTNRTDRIRIKQIIDGNIEGDANDKSTYFGDVMERENNKPVSVIMAEISFKQLQDIYEVIVYTMIDKEKNKNFLSSCELGYYDQFDRLQWAGKKKSKESDECIIFQLARPILTKSVLLKIEGGKSRITEVTVLGKSIEK